MSAYQKALERYRVALSSSQAVHADPHATRLQRLEADAEFAAAGRFKLRFAIDPEYNPDRVKVMAP